MCREHSTEATTKQSIFEDNILYQPRASHCKSKTVMKNLLGLPTYISKLLDDSELNKFEQKVRKICIEKKLPSASDGKGMKLSSV